MVFVTPARYADLATMASVLGDAFSLDAPTQALLNTEPSQRRRRTASLFRALLSSGPLDAGSVDVARQDQNGRVVGVAIWHDPAQRPGGVPHYLAELAGFLRAFGLIGMARGIAAARASATHRPTAPHWYLQAIGVSSEFHSQGVGSCLLRHRLAAVDARGAASYLESSTDTTSRLYRRHGFVELGPVTGFPGEAPPTAMWREARPLVRCGCPCSDHLTD